MGDRPLVNLGVEQFLRQERDKKLEVILNGKKYSWALVGCIEELKKLLVETEPEQAIRIYHQVQDRELGTMFVEEYKNSKNHGGAAYHMALELGILGVEKPRTIVDEAIEKLEATYGGWVRHRIVESTRPAIQNG